MNDTPAPQAADPVALDPGLRFLKVLVTVLTLTMIIGLITVATVFVTRFPGAGAGDLTVPAGLSLPAGTKAEAVTRGKGWIAIVTDRNEILVFDGTTGKLRHRYPLGD